MSSVNIPAIEVRFRDGEHFVGAFDPGTSRLRLDDREPTAVAGELCQVRIYFEDRDADFRLHGYLREDDGGRFAIELHPDEGNRLALVMVAARGESLPYQRRRHPRIPCQLGARVRRDDSGEVAEVPINEISAGGAFVAMESPPSVDSRFELGIAFPGGRKLELSARIVNIVESGPVTGCSVEFLFSSGEQRDRCAALVAELPHPTTD